jgi:hypothetical protein
MSRVTFFFVSIIVLLGSCSKEKKTTLIGDDQVGMIGYGSLMSLQSMEESLGREYLDSSYIVHVGGYEREWTYIRRNDDPLTGPDTTGKKGFYIHNNDTVPFHSTISLNIAENKNSTINGILYIISKKELELFDKREIGYKRIDVTRGIQEYEITNGKVYTYMATPEYTKGIAFDSVSDIIEKSYVELVYQACDSLGVTFRKEYDVSTKPFNARVADKIFWRK